MEKFRIKEEKYESGNSKFFPQGYFEEQWKTLSYKSFGFNNNGLDWCKTLEEAQKFIESFRVSLANSVDKVIEEKIYEVS